MPCCGSLTRAPIGLCGRRTSWPRLGEPWSTASTSAPNGLTTAFAFGYNDLIAAMNNHYKDRHVLAAAVRERAEVIVTTNLKHFPDDALKPYQIKALHPDDFLLDQLDLYEEATKAVILGMVDAYIDPPFTPHSLLDALGEQVPQFAAKARRLFPSGSPFGLGVLLPFGQ
ncbi:hypothetical protein FML86_00275 [Mycobacterium tuberculosis]|nr:hypothetical protein FML86_00275 [Mycobacterium tuberculosis]